MRIAMGDPADIVKTLHARLREELESGDDVEEVWSNLLSDKPLLETYSQAMSTLARGSWEAQSSNGASRIQWCMQVCEEYFAHHGMLHKLLCKDLRRSDHKMPTLVPLPLLPPSLEEVHKMAEVWNGKALRLLDVGSCYNPFHQHAQFQVTAIDIAPADKSVLECDFLSVPISDHCPSATSAPSSPVSTLQADHYDVVVFSLLLSFLPAPRQRLECCLRAHHVLKLHGLLLVITPDSSHQNKHAVMMKDWKVCIEGVGFHRWKYFKDVHLHCMAFRKTQPTKHDYGGLGKTSHLLHIPQDSQQKPSISATCQSFSESDSSKALSHLPFSFDLSSEASSSS